MLLALHGFTENDLTWHEILDNQVKGLVSPLLPGHGWKPCPAGTTIESLSDDLAARHLDRPADLFGYSMGGRIALTLALRHPRQVKRLVLISSGPGFKDGHLQEGRRTHEMALADTLEEEGLGPFVAMWEKNPILRTAKPLPRVVEEDLRARRMQHDPSGLAGALRQLGAGAMPNLWGRLGELSCPTLLIAGEVDERYREVMSEMAGLIPNATLEVVAESGHGIHREQPGAIRSLVRSFLADA